MRRSGRCNSLLVLALRSDAAWSRMMKCLFVFSWQVRGSKTSAKDDEAALAFSFVFDHFFHSSNGQFGEAGSSGCVGKFANSYIARCRWFHLVEQNDIRLMAFTLPSLFKQRLLVPEYTEHTPCKTSHKVIFRNAHRFEIVFWVRLVCWASCAFYLCSWISSSFHEMAGMGLVGLGRGRSFLV